MINVGVIAMIGVAAKEIILAFQSKAVEQAKRTNNLARFALHLPEPRPSTVRVERADFYAMWTVATLTKGS